jgi:hypothetical protein
MNNKMQNSLLAEQNFKRTRTKGGTEIRSSNGNKQSDYRCKLCIDNNSVVNMQRQPHTKDWRTGQG